MAWGPGVLARVLDDSAGWQIVSATDGHAQPVDAASLSTADWGELRRRIAGRPWAYAALTTPAPSFAPCVGSGETLDPKGIVLRVFLMFDGSSWRPFPGGVARVLEAHGPPGRSLPDAALSKDVWVLQEEGFDIHGPGNLAMKPLPIRRTPGDMPSRVADNFYWLGRYLERLENAARLIRIVLGRLRATRCCRATCRTWRPWRAAWSMPASCRRNGPAAPEPRNLPICCCALWRATPAPSPGSPAGCAT